MLRPVASESECRGRAVMTLVKSMFGKQLLDEMAPSFVEYVDDPTEQHMLNLLSSLAAIVDRQTREGRQGGRKGGRKGGRQREI
jgi:hypothetical protein